MYYEEPRIPALPGEENVTDGALEEEMAKCAATPCDVKTTCPDNDPEQTDVPSYEIVTE